MTNTRVLTNPENLRYKTTEESTNQSNGKTLVSGKFLSKGLELHAHFALPNDVKIEQLIPINLVCLPGKKRFEAGYCLAIDVGEDEETTVYRSEEDGGGSFKYFLYPKK